MSAPSVDTWSAPPDLLTIDDQEVHVWRARLDLPVARLNQLQAQLKEEERLRARRFRFPIHQSRFVARRGLLRVILASYLGTSSADIDLEYTSYGKPRLARRHGADLQFNASQSEDVMLCALTRRRNVGVDIERIDHGRAGGLVADQFFSAREAALLRAIPKSRQTTAFFDCWVRKEAYIKAQGMGLSLALDSFDVSFGDGLSPRILRTSPDPLEAGRWTIVALSPAPGYAGALVYEGPRRTLRLWHWPAISDSPSPFRPRPAQGNTV